MKQEQAERSFIAQKQQQSDPSSAQYFSLAVDQNSNNYYNTPTRAKSTTTATTTTTTATAVPSTTGANTRNNNRNSSNNMKLRQMIDALSFENVLHTYPHANNHHHHDSNERQILQPQAPVGNVIARKSNGRTASDSQFHIPRPFRKLYNNVVGSNKNKSTKKVSGHSENDESSTTTTATTTDIGAAVAQQESTATTTKILEYSNTVGSEGSEVFYDAFQSESDLSSAAVPFVLPSILVHRGGFETILDENHHHQDDGNNYNQITNHPPVPRRNDNDHVSRQQQRHRINSSFDSTDENANVTGVFTGIGSTMTFLTTQSHSSSRNSGDTLTGASRDLPNSASVSCASSSACTANDALSVASIEQKGANDKLAFIPPPPPPRQQHLQQQQDQQHIRQPPPPPPRQSLLEQDYPRLPPLPPAELPLRFLRAGKNDPIVGKRRYEETLQWRADEKIDTILREPSPNFYTIKQHYPHYCHRQGLKGEPCFYEQPPKTNLKALRDGGVTLDALLRHYAQITEYQWQYITQDDFQTSIYVIDLEGIRFGDFVGETVDFVKRASALSATHYPERAGVVYVINVPVWFKVIWNVVKPIIDEATLQKIFILRGKEEIRRKMQERVALENIPPEYGGTSMPLGQSPEEITLKELIDHNNALAAQQKVRCDHYSTCKFCSWQPPRSY